MFFRIFLVAAAIATVLVLAKEKKWFEEAGLLGKCAVVATPSGEQGQWWSCEEGWLSGFPRLDGDGCTLETRPHAREIWRCPAPLESAPGPF